MKKIEFTGHYNEGHFELSSNVNNDEIKGYFKTILEENAIAISNSKEELLQKINEGHFIYPGGITFYDNDKIHITGCCFDLNDIKEACTNIRNSEHTWLGHDPDMVIKYTDNKVIIFESDDFKKEREPDVNEKIEYSKDEIIYLIDSANNNLKQFIDIFYNYLKENYSDIADILYNDLKKYML